jgi:hypothetical protein
LPGRYFLRAYGYFPDNPDMTRLVIAAVIPLLKLSTPAMFLGHLGWFSLLTDPGYSGVLVSMRSLHVAFAALS